MIYRPCDRCGVKMPQDVDCYGMPFCSGCIDEMTRDADTREQRIANGDINVPNPTPKERERILAARKKQRDAILPD